MFILYCLRDVGFCFWAKNVVLVMKISIRMPVIVDIWVFVSMISFMLVQVEHTYFLPHRLGIMRRFVGSFVL